MGTLFLAKHLARGRSVAVKLPSVPVLRASDAAAIAALKDEARVVMELARDHIVQVSDFVEEQAGEVAS